VITKLTEIWKAEQRAFSARDLSAESRADLLRDCARRGMRAPVLAIGDGALGFWKTTPAPR
jgi:hypothetical protein